MICPRGNLDTVSSCNGEEHVDRVVRGVKWGNLD